MYRSVDAIKPDVSCCWQFLEMEFIKGGVFWLCFLTWSAEAGYFVWNMDAIIPKHIIPGHKFVVYCDLTTAYNDVNIPMNGSHAIDLTLRPSAPNMFKPGTVSVLADKDTPRISLSIQFPKNLKTSKYSGFLTVTKGREKIAEHEFFANINGDYVDKRFRLVQTDKGIYKAGETVQFRILVINKHRKVVQETFTIEIFDADSNRLRRWTNVTDSSGVFVGRMELSNYPVLGEWTIKVSNEELNTTTHFDVEEFEVPKFYVELDFPETVNTGTEASLKGKVSAFYMFGKGVHGVMELTLKYSNYSVVKQFKVKDGFVDIDLPYEELASDFRASSRAQGMFKGSRRYYFDNLRLDISANVVENVTGVNMSAKSYIDVKVYDVKLRITHGTKFYIGQDVHISMQIIRHSGDPYIGKALPGVDLWLGVNLYTMNSTPVIFRKFSRIDFGENNTMTYTIKGKDLQSNVSLIFGSAVVRKAGTRNVLHTVQTFRIFSSTHPIVNPPLTLKQESGTKNMNVGDIATFRISVTGDNVTATYMVASNGWFVDVGAFLGLSKDKPKIITVTATKDMLPNFVVMAWTGHGLKGDIDALQVDIEPDDDESSEVQTHISFDVEEVRPGGAAKINLEGKAGSNFYLLAVDKNILLLDRGNDITENMLPSSVDVKRGITLDTASFSSIFHSVWSYYTRVSLREYTDTFTTTTTYAGSSTLAVESETTTALETSSSISNRQPENKEKQRKTITLRKKFPDTWLFNNVSSGETGIAEFIATAPDTITTWVATCFAVDGKSRLSVAATNAELRVLLPFFVSVQLPFSVIRNEQVAIQANVFNYHSEDLYVLVTLIKNDSFRGLAISKRGKKRKLKEKCGNLVLCILAKSGRATPAYFPIIPLVMGDIKLTITADSEKAKDTVVKTLRVEPEGAEESLAYPFLIDLTQKDTFDYSFQLAYPPNVVEGSQRMRLTVTGDVMGPTIDNLETFVRQPEGSGEQSLRSTAMSVFLMGYLTAVDRFEANLKKRTERYIENGIQLQMRYKHADWSFSAWGGSESGSSWLTSFVLKVFSKGTFYVDVDKRLITLPTAYLLSTQKKDGSFPELGQVNNRYMQGGPVDTVEQMTAYVLIALLEAKQAGNENIEFSTHQDRELEAGINNGMEFLERHLENITSVYSLAITTYALGLGESRLASDALALLKRNGKAAEGMLYWEETVSVPSKYHIGSSTTAQSIEMTAYALLAISKNGDKVDGARVNKWLISRRNALGEFISVQDTIVGLEALASFWVLMSSPPHDITIKVSYMDEVHHERKFRITTKNALVLQTAELSTDTKEIKVHAFGNSNAIITVALFYNIFMDLEDQGLRLYVDVVKEAANGFTISSCISWLKNNSSGMVVAEIGIPSGFKAFSYGISAHELLMQTEIQEKKVVLYFDQITQAKVCVDISMVRDTMVASVKKVPCKVYEYYEPSNEMTVFYAPLGAKNSNICDGMECGCAGENDRKLMKRCKSKVSK